MKLITTALLALFMFAGIAPSVQADPNDGSKQEEKQDRHRN